VNGTALFFPGIDDRTLIFKLPAVNCHFVVDLCCIVHCKSSWWIRGLPVLVSICIRTHWRVVTGMSETWFTLQVIDSITYH
jgi:hypothetical protein